MALGMPLRVYTKDGSIKKLKLVRGDPTLAKAAMEAIWRWRYEPIMVAHKPVEFGTEIHVIFKLPKQHKRG